MFYGLTERGQRVLTALAQSIARGGHCDYLQPEHIVQAITRAEGALGSIALRRAGIELEELRDEMEQALPQGGGRPILGDLPPPRSKSSLYRASVEAKRLGHDFIGTAHLLLACMKEKGSAANRYFAERGIDEAHILRSLDDARARWDYDALAPE